MSTSSSSTDFLAFDSPSPSECPSTPLSPLSTPALPDSKEPSTSTHSRWRPSYHIQPATGWMNDPCAPGYNASTRLYHVSFQWNPHGPDWGDIAWGTATSPDLIHWTIQPAPSLSPDAPYDDKGVFTGCQVPTRDGSLTYAYTSVNALPIHHTLPHARGSESLSLARSLDEGVSWEKLDANPILPCEPAGIDVTGWRDPFVASWPSMARFLHRDPEITLFGIISGGIRDVTPTTFLYAINADDLLTWEYIGPLADVGLNFSPGRWSGDFGVNWEVTNFLTLPSANGVSKEVLIMGTEGCIPPPSSTSEVSVGPTRPARCQLWMSGFLSTPKQTTHSGPVELRHVSSGHLDHGAFYAANSFHDPVSEKQIVWGWITEDDLCDELRHAQGWSGMLSMPREVYVQTLRGVVRGCVSELKDITSVEAEVDGEGTYTVSTLASQPYIPLVDALRNGPGVQKSEMGRTELDTAGVVLGDIRTAHWELDASFAITPQTQRIGVSIEHISDASCTTQLSFSPHTETFTISRPPLSNTPNSATLINSEPEVAPHTLFTIRDSVTGAAETEKLRIRVWRDNSVLEVFINERTAISTRVYGGDETLRMRFFAEGGGVLEGVEFWDGIELA